MTPTCEMPAIAFGSSGNRLRPPRRKLSSTPSSSMRSTWKTLDSKRFGWRAVISVGRRRVRAEELDLVGFFLQRVEGGVGGLGVDDFEVDVEPVLPGAVWHRPRVKPREVDTPFGKARQCRHQAAGPVRADERER